MTQELKDALKTMPHVKSVWLEENGAWHINKPQNKEVMEMEACEILGEDKEDKPLSKMYGSEEPKAKPAKK